ncbi:hypothetical protein I350_03183 [Cryptococcus amylolentus CBS 6273]|uniref:Uncharacterized protein n=1 Tax=Cryptococcus amylolentus CBS 6273 TaxID=1296118 RepID=A0A1E3K904_9TREE|nr:hypothetical protein I350_03183 [Cryptococcus amylolentus CBS 6273]
MQVEASEHSSAAGSEAESQAGSQRDLICGKSLKTEKNIRKHLFDLHKNQLHSDFLRPLNPSTRNVSRPDAKLEEITNKLRDRKVGVKRGPLYDFGTPGVFQHQDHTELGELGLGDSLFETSHVSPVNVEVARHLSPSLPLESKEANPSVTRIILRIPPRRENGLSEKENVPNTLCDPKEWGFMLDEEGLLLLELSGPARNYIDTFDTAHYACHAFPIARFDLVSSNTGLLVARGGDIITLFSTIYDHLRASFRDRHHLLVVKPRLVERDLIQHVFRKVAAEKRKAKDYSALVTN